MNPYGIGGEPNRAVKAASNFFTKYPFEVALSSVAAKRGFSFPKKAIKGGCAGKSKDNGVEFSYAIVTRLCLELDTFSEVELTPLNCCPTVKNKKIVMNFPSVYVFADSKGDPPFCGAFV